MAGPAQKYAPEEKHPEMASNYSEAGLQGLWKAAILGVRDNAIGEIGVQALRVGGLIILARELTPDDFGLFRVLLITSAFAMLLNDSGIPNALVQRKVLTRTHESTAWCLSILLAGLSVAAMYAAAPMIAVAMQMPRLTDGIRLLCIPILLEGTAVTANARLQRQLRFGALAAADVVGEAGFLVVALAVLWRGYPRLSLTAGLGARFAFHALAVWIADPYLPSTLPRVRAARDFARFSSSVVGGRIIYVLSSNADFLLVGRLLGSSALGFYSMAWDLLRFIPDRLNRVAGRVTFPAFCRLQDDNPRLTRVYQDFFRYVAQIIVPIVACASIAAPTLIGFVYGSKWIPAALPMRLLAPGLILMGLRAGIGSVYFSKNYPSFDIYLHGARLILILVVVSATVPLGLTAVSTGMSFVEGAISIAGQWMACWLIELSLMALVANVIPALILAVWCCVATIAGIGISEVFELHGVVLVAMEVVPAALVFVWREASVLTDFLSKAAGKSAAVELTEGPA